MEIDITYAHSLTDISQLLAYIVEIYGKDIYTDRKRLVGLISDLYQGEERMKRIYKRAIMEDNLSLQIYSLLDKDTSTRQARIGAIIMQYTEANLFSRRVGKNIVEAFVRGMFPVSTKATSEDVESPDNLQISTKATPEDGEWVDKFGVVYSADRKKLIKFRRNPGYKTYRVLDGTKVICDMAFYYDPFLTSVILPDSLTCIGGAFQGCSSLVSINLPNGLTSIGYRAFYSCTSLTSITLPDSLTSIGREVFYNCKSLKSITLPTGLTSIEGGFCDCSTRLFLGKDNKQFVIIGDILYTADRKKLIQCNSRNSHIVVLKDVEIIGESAFLACESLIFAILPEGLTSIGASAFCSCHSLKSITLPNSVASIGAWGFRWCKSLTSISLSESLTSIGNEAFDGCESLTSITLPERVMSIGSGFCECSTKLSLSKKNRHFVIIDDILYTADRKKLIHCNSPKTRIVVYENVEAIGAGAFSACTSLTSIALPECLASIGNYAFDGCESLTSITLPDSLSNIGNGAFQQCKSLTSITLPTRVTSIGDCAFWNCASLASITLPDSLTSIGDSAFYGCTSLFSIVLNSRNTHFKLVNGDLYTKDGKLIFSRRNADPFYELKKYWK